MKEGYKNYSLILEYGFLIGISFLLIDLYSSLNYEQWLRIIGLHICIIFVLSMLMLKVAGVAFLSLSSLFTIFTFIFHFGQLVILTFGFHYKFTIVNYSKWLEQEPFKRTILFSFFVFMTMTLGILISTKNRLKNKLTKKINRNKEKIIDIKLLGYLILISTFPIKLILDLYQIYFSMRYGYVGMLEMGISGVILQIAQFYIIGVVLLLLAYQGNRWKATMIFFLSALYCIFSMLSGGKSRPTIHIVLLCYVYFTTVVKLKWTQILKYGIVGYLMVLFLNTVTIVRAEGITSIQNFLLLMLSSDQNPIFKVLEEFGSTIYTVYQAIVIVPEKLSYAYGVTYLASLSQVLLNIGGILNHATNIAQFAIHLNEGYPLGGSYIAELYYNFGYIPSLFLGVVIGGFVNNISVRMEFYLKNGAYVQFSYFIMLFTSIIWWVRAGFIDLIRGTVWSILLIMVFSLFCKLRKRHTEERKREVGSIYKHHSTSL